MYICVCMYYQDKVKSRFAIYTLNLFNKQSNTHTHIHRKSLSKKDSKRIARLTKRRNKNDQSKIQCCPSQWTNCYKCVIIIIIWQMLCTYIQIFNTLFVYILYALTCSLGILLFLLCSQSAHCIIVFCPYRILGGFNALSMYLFIIVVLYRFVNIYC